jgi:hypothetical protein
VTKERQEQASAAGKKSRRKGQAGENEVARLIRGELEHLGLDDLTVKRVLTETRESSYDLQVLKTVKGVELRCYYAIQVKNVCRDFGKWLLTAWREANAGKDDPMDVAVGVVKVPTEAKGERRDQWLAVVPLHYFAHVLGMDHIYQVAPPEEVRKAVREKMEKGKKRG